LQSPFFWGEKIKRKQNLHGQTSWKARTFSINQTNTSSKGRRFKPNQQSNEGKQATVTAVAIAGVKGIGARSLRGGGVN